MSEKTLQLTRRRALGALVTIGVGGAAAGAGTLAAFSDTESSSGNTVQAGTLDLTIDNPGSFSFEAKDLAPGDPVGTATATLTNAGNVDGDLSIDLTLSQNDSAATSEADSVGSVDAQTFAEAIQVTSLTYGGTEKIGSEFNASSGPFGQGTSYVSLWDVAGNSDPDLSGLTDPGDGTDFTIDMTFRSEAGNKYQADGVDIEFTFDLEQQTS